MTRTAYFNGKFVPETEVLIPYRDRSFNRGDGCFDMTRTFDGRIFRLAEHVERLYRSLRYLRIDIGLEPKEVVAISEEVVLRNEHLRVAAGVPSARRYSFLYWDMRKPQCWQRSRPDRICSVRSYP
jgi:branched-chain amino acid aminotransferase